MLAIAMVTSEVRQRANLNRMKELMEAIENTTNDSALIIELKELLRKNYPLSLKWHLIIFKSEVERSLKYLEDIRKEEVKIASRHRKLGKEAKEGPKQVYFKSSDIPTEFKLDYCLVYDTDIDQYKWLKCNTPKNTRAKVFTIPKSMIGDVRLKWSEETKQKWGEDRIGQMEMVERAINN
jgi:ribosomal protein S24E